MSLAPAIGMGIGAMCATMLRLPLTSALLATVLLGADGVSVTPQVIIAVVVAFVITMVLPTPGPERAGSAACRRRETCCRLKMSHHLCGRQTTRSYRPDSPDWWNLPGRRMIGHPACATNQTSPAVRPA